MAKPIAVITGTALRPGVSKNRRYYSPAAVERAVKRAQERIAGGGPPLTMLTHHAAEDDSQRIVGALVEMTLGEDGEARYKAHIANTDAGRNIVELIDPDGGGPFLEGVSIRGFWLDPLRKEDHDGMTVETADELELDGLDFTKTPGVDGARVDTVTRMGAGRPRETSDGRTLIYESVEARVQDTIQETADALNAQAAATETERQVHTWADPTGYRPDREKRWPLDTAAEAATAWAQLADETVARDYTSKQLKRMRSRTRAALAGHGVQVTSEGYLRTAGPVGETAALEMFGGDELAGKTPGGFDVCLHIGSLRVSVSSYCVDPHDLDRIARAAAAAASDALTAVQADPDAALADPIEGGGKRPAFLDDDQDDDEDAEEGSGKVEDDDEKDGMKPRESTPSTTPTAAEAANTTPKEETAVADTTTPAQDANETEEQRIERLVAERIAAEEARKAEEARVEALVAERLAAQQATEETEEARIERLVAERLAAQGAEQATQETEEQRIERLVQAQVTAALQGHVERNGVPARTGLTATPGAGAATAEAATDGYPADWPRHADGRAKAMHELTETERDAHVYPALEQYTMGQRSVFANGA